MALASVHNPQGIDLDSKYSRDNVCPLRQYDFLNDPSPLRDAAVARSNILPLLAAVFAALVLLGFHNWELESPNAKLSYTLPLGYRAVPTGVLLPFTFFLCESPH